MPTVQSFANYVRKHWGYLLQFGAWVMTVLGSFVLPPPVWDFREDAVWYRFAHFVVSALLGLTFILISSRNAKRHTRFWWGVSAAALAVGVVTFFVYQSLRADWTVNYSNARVVIGETYTKEAEDYREQIRREQGRELPDEELVMDYAGGTESIWDKGSIRRRRLIIASTYVTSLSLFALTIITLIQALYCNSRKR